MKGDLLKAYTSLSEAVSFLDGVITPINSDRVGSLQKEIARIMEQIYSLRISK